MPYLSPIIACASACSHSWKGQTVHHRETHICILHIGLYSYKGNLEIAHSEFIMELIVFFSCFAIPLNKKWSYIRIIYRQVLVIPFPPLLSGLGVLSLHSRSSKTCLIFTIQVPVKVKPKDLNSL